MLKSVISHSSSPKPPDCRKGRRAHMLERADHRGGISRRSLLKAGVLGLAGLGLPDWLKAQAVARAAGRPSPADLSVILVWLDGGPPQHETYDPKPDAPVEFRGPLHPMDTCVPGIRIS